MTSKKYIFTILFLISIIKLNIAHTSTGTTADTRLQQTQQMLSRLAELKEKNKQDIEKLKLEAEKREKLLAGIPASVPEKKFDDGRVKSLIRKFEDMSNSQTPNKNNQVSNKPSNDIKAKLENELTQIRALIATRDKEMTDLETKIKNFQNRLIEIKK